MDHRHRSIRRRVVVVAGGYRTGSTLQYNLLGTYLELIGQGRRIGLVEPDSIETIITPAIHSDTGTLVAKCHHVAEGLGLFENETAWKDMVESGLATPISTLRDDSETRRSMCRKFGIPPDQLESSDHWAVNEANKKAWRLLGAWQQTYDDLTSRPLQALTDLTQYLGIGWRDHAAKSAVELTDVEHAVESMIELEEGAWDPVSLLHWDHISTGLNDTTDPDGTNNTASSGC